jgi:hypothetical protein
MNVIFVHPNFQKHHLIPLHNFKANPFQNLIDPIIERYSTISRRQRYVVRQYRHVVALVEIFAHPASLRRKRREIRPEEIQILEI